MHLQNLKDIDDDAESLISDAQQYENILASFNDTSCPDYVKNALSGAVTYVPHAFA